MTFNLVLTQKDDAYRPFLHWMIRHQQRQLTLSTSTNSPAGGSSTKQSVFESLFLRYGPRVHDAEIETRNTEGLTAEATHSYIPGEGDFVILYKKTLIAVNRERNLRSLDLNTGRPYEKVKLTTLYSRRHIFDDLITEAGHLMQQEIEGNTIIYRPQTSSWVQFGESQKRKSLDSVVLDNGVKERIVSDVKNFLQIRDWYHDRGIPCRRGYLLHGPPGTGKTSFIRALAGELNYDLATLNVAERGMTDDRLLVLLSVLPKRTMVVLEDADTTLAKQHTDVDGYQGSRVSYSGLLNALDGLVTSERLLFMTTNHPERLDGAMIRPGRIDVTEYLGGVTRWQAGRLWDLFYGELDGDGSYKSQFLARLEELGLIEGKDGERKMPGRSTSAAALQGLFLTNKDNAMGAVDMIPCLVPKNWMADQNETPGPMSASQSYG